MITPLEIEAIIIDFLAQNGRDLISQGSSRVCRAFLYLCWKHIFGSIVLDLDGRSNVASPSSYATSHKLEQLKNAETNL